MIVEIHPVIPQERLISKVVDCLRNDGIIIFPTDTCYGIGCSIFSKKAVGRIYQVKGFDKKKQLSIVCADIADISRYAVISDLAYRNMKRLLPGPYTWVLPATKLVPKKLHSNRKEVGIRIPDNKICMELVRALGHPLLSAGAGDQTRGLPGTVAGDLDELYGEVVNMVVDGGVLQDTYSTVLKVDDNRVEVVRQGLGKVDFL
jgi:tRNA threonylcarbamoyl adenosine modification protein (Sua5/YciO/YrdC/YwlC family)